jgi:hypothetical protein
VRLGFLMELAEQRAGPGVQQHRVALGEQWAPIGGTTTGSRVRNNDDRACAGARKLSRPAVQR